jgi:phage terminase small subunit
MRERHRRFVLEYIIDLNGRAAAERTGYAPGKAGARAWELLHRADVQEMLQAELKAREERTRVTGDRVIHEYACIAFIDPSRIASWGPEGVTLVSSERMSADDKAAVKRISVGGRKGARAQRFELHDKLAALDALGRFTGVFTRGKGGRNAVPDYASPENRDWRDELRRRIQKMIEQKAAALAEVLAARKIAAMKELERKAEGEEEKEEEAAGEKAAEETAEKSGAG